MHGLPKKKMIQKCIRRFVFTYSLYKDVVSSSGYLVSSVRLISES